jgi:predicted ATPase
LRYSTDENNFAFSQPLLREVLYEELAVSRRVELHARIVHALEAQANGAIAPSVLAFHARKALPALGHAHAVEHCARAGQLALRAHSYDEAVQLYEHALSTAEQAPERDELQIANLCMGRAKALFSAGKLAPGRAACERAIELA